MNREAYLDIPCWYVVYTHPRQEDRADMNLRAWNVQTFVPKIKQRRYNQFTGAISYATKHLFPRYIFARFKGNDLLHKINYTRGVHSLVSFDDYPTPVDERIINLIKSRTLDDRLVKPPDDLQPGDAVEVKDGPLGRFTGIFEQHMQDCERVRILLQTVSYQAHILINREFVSKVDKSAAAAH